MRTSRTVSYRSVRLLILCGAASAALYGASCSSSGSSSSADEDMGNPALADVIYDDQKTTDEALEKFLDATAKEDAAKAPAFDSPTEGQMVDGATPLTFTWHSGPTAALPSAPTLRFASLRARSVASPLAELFGPERAARAHGEPFSGTAYWLVFSSPSDPKLVRVFTGEKSYTPKADVWDKIKAGGTITVEISSAILTENNVDTDGGPWKGKAVHFTVK